MKDRGRYKSGKRENFYQLLLSCCEMYDKRLNILVLQDQNPQNNVVLRCCFVGCDFAKQEYTVNFVLQFM